VITFTPDPNYSGTVTFPYEISDGQGGTATANEIINVTPVNDPPVAIVDYNTTNEDTPVTGTVIANDSDVDGNLNPVGYSMVSGPTSGTVVLNPNGTYTYTPAPGYFGTADFIYTVCDLGLPVYCDTAIVYITITSVNDLPVAVNDIYTTAEDTPVSGNILLNDSDPDGDPLTVTNINFGGSNYPIVVGTPTVVTLTEGTLTINSDGTFTFDPSPGFNGAVPTGTYTIIDGNGGNASATLSIFVNPVNDPPIAEDNSYTTFEDTPILTANVITDAGPLVDSDPDGDILTVSSFDVGGITYPAGATVTIPGVGAVTIYSNGLMNFTPAPNFAGPVPTIPYTISDGNGGTSTANIDITVTAVNDPPVAVANYATTFEDTPVTIAILGNDTDLDGTLDPATIDLDQSTPGIQQGKGRL
jgi:CshA-type fibril repeat protein